MTTIALATCRAWPELVASDQLLADELERRGCTVRALPWNGAPLNEFTAADVIVLRANWDYHHEILRFRNWLDAIEASDCVVLNSVDLVRSTLDKAAYLARLNDAGIRTARTLPVRLATDQGQPRMDPDPAQIARWADEHGLNRLVLKPTYGASGHDVDLVGRAELESACRERARRPDARPFLVQQFLPGIAAGELSVVFFDGRYSHAYRRTPAAPDFRVNGGHGGATSAEVDVDTRAVAFAAGVLDSVPAAPTYARIDIIGSGPDDFTLMELEINEPALGLHLAPGSDVAFADAVTRHIV